MTHTDSTTVSIATDTVVVRYFAAAKAATGIADERVDLPGSATLGGLLEVLRARHPAEFATVLERCSFLVDEVSARPDTALAAGSEVDILPPFAGG